MNEEYYEEWIHRGCGGNLVIEIDAGKKTINGEIREGLIFKLKCTKCHYEKEFVFLGFDSDEEEGGEE